MSFASLDLVNRSGRFRRFVLLAFSACGVACGSGCSNMSVSMKYSPLAATDSLVDSCGKLKILVVRFTDERTKRDEIGAMENVYGTKVKKIVTTDDLGTILAEAITDALRKSGMEADLHLDRRSDEQVPPEELKGRDLVMGGRVKTLRVETKPGWDTVKVNAGVVIEVLVRRGEKLEWIGPIEGAAERRETAYVNSEAIASALDTATQNCMRNLIRHLKASGSLQHN